MLLIRMAVCYMLEREGLEGGKDEGDKGGIEYARRRGLVRTSQNRLHCSLMRMPGQMLPRPVGSQGLG